MDLSERIKLIRKSCGITQKILAEKLGLKQNTIASYEIGKLSPSDRTISDICREFRISEVWLRTGEGEMFLQLDDDAELMQVLSEIQLSDDDMIKDLLISYWNLSDEEKLAIKKLVNSFIERKRRKAGE